MASGKNRIALELENERPKRVATIRRIVKETVDFLEGQIVDAECRFLKENSSIEQDIRQVLPSIRRLMDSTQVPAVHSALHMERLAGPDPTSYPVTSSSDDAHAVREYHQKIIQFVPAEFAPMANTVRELVQILGRYCLSFYPEHYVTTCELLEYPAHYHLEQREIRTGIERYLGNITNMANGYRNAGVMAAMFGLRANEIARRCNCGDAPALLIFPQACQGMRNACECIRKWINTDKQYASFVLSDISRAEEKYEQQSKALWDHRRNQALLQFKLKSVAKEITTLDADLVKLRPKGGVINNEIRKLKRDINIIQLDISTLEDERVQLLAEQSDAETMNRNIRLKTIARDISRLRQAIPAVERDILALESKKNPIMSKLAARVEKRQLQDLLQHQLVKALADVRQAEEDFKQTEAGVSILRDIYRQKTSGEFADKVFYSMPTEIRTPRMKSDPNPQADVLGSACLITARRIEQDWPKLYRMLPFHPHRGEQTLDEDIRKIVLSKCRADDKERAAESLALWRRRNTRASACELLEALRLIGRSDIARKLQPPEGKTASRDRSQSGEVKEQQKPPRAVSTQTSHTKGNGGKKQTEPNDKLSRNGVKTSHVMAQSIKNTDHSLALGLPKVTITNNTG